MILIYFSSRPILLLLLLVFMFPSVSAVAVIDIAQLTHGTDSGNPAWSPDGSRIVYTAGSDENYSILVMNADGSNPVKLISGIGIPRWSPDGSKIVFQRGDSIYIMNSDGSNQKFLIAPARSPSISPDGQYIAFDAGAINIVSAGVNLTDIKGGIMGGVTPEMGRGIVVMNINGTNIKRLTDDPGDEIMPSWSPDGKKIVFTEGGIIIIMNAEGSNVKSTGQSGYYARWSPDGEHIAFLSERGGDMFQGMKLDHIYLMDIDGTNITQLTFGDKRWDGLLDWSPDGTKIVFDSMIPPKAIGGISNIYIMTLDFNVIPTPTPIVPGFSFLATFVSLIALVLIKRINKNKGGKS